MNEREERSNEQTVAISREKNEGDARGGDASFARLVLTHELQRTCATQGTATRDTRGPVVTIIDSSHYP